MAKYKNIIVSTALVLVAIFIISFILLKANHAFVLSNVKVAGNRFLSKADIIELAKLDYSKEIFNIDLKSIKQRLEAQSIIKNASVSWSFPSAIKIKIQEQDIIAVIAGDGTQAVIRDGKILKVDRPVAIYDLPIITGVSGKRLENKQNSLSPVMIDMIKLVTALRAIDIQLYTDISEFHYDSRTGFIAFLRQRTIPIILGFDNLKDKLLYLAAVYPCLLSNKELTQAKVIDVRFDKQVVVKS
jgi:cell division septal protein FtsQ